MDPGAKAKTIMRRIFLICVLGLPLFAQFHLPGAADGAADSKPRTSRSKRKAHAAESPSDQQAAASFDYYVLSLSWAPGFCANPSNASANPKECAPGTHLGFIVHGLWPETNS